MFARIFGFVIHIISGIFSRLRGHFYFIDNSTLGLVTRLRTGNPRSSSKRLQLLLYPHLILLVYPLIFIRCVCSIQKVYPGFPGPCQEEKRY